MQDGHHLSVVFAAPGGTVVDLVEQKLFHSLLPVLSVLRVAKGLHSIAVERGHFLTHEHPGMQLDRVEVLSLLSLQLAQGGFLVHSGGIVFEGVGDFPERRLDICVGYSPNIRSISGFGGGGSSVNSPVRRNRRLSSSSF